MAIPQRPETAEASTAVFGRHAATDDTAVTLSAERLRTDTQWVESGRLTLRRRVVTETRLVEVTLRREELVVDEAYPPPDDVPGVVADPDHREHDPWVVELRREVPDIAVRVEPYEHVHVSTQYVTVDQIVQSAIRHEDVEYDVAPATAPRQ